MEYVNFSLVDQKENHISSKIKRGRWSENTKTDLGGVDFGKALDDVEHSADDFLLIEVNVAVR